MLMNISLSIDSIDVFLPSLSFPSFGQARQEAEQQQSVSVCEEGAQTDRLTLPSR